MNELFQRIVNCRKGISLNINRELCSIAAEDWWVSAHVVAGDRAGRCRTGRRDGGVDLKGSTREGCSGVGPEAARLPRFWGLGLLFDFVVDQHTYLLSPASSFPALALTTTIAGMQSSLPPAQSTTPPRDDAGHPQLEHQMDQGPPPSSFQQHPDEDARPDSLHSQNHEPGSVPPSGPGQSRNGSPTANGSLEANGERDAASQGSHSRATTATTTPFDGALKFDPSTNAYRPKMIKVDVRFSPFSSALLSRPVFVRFIALLLFLGQLGFWLGDEFRLLAAPHTTHLISGGLCYLLAFGLVLCCLLWVLWKILCTPRAFPLGFSLVLTLPSFPPSMGGNL